MYLLGLRHPFVAARAFTTLDVVSGGRAEIGVGAGWLASEMTATLGIEGDPFAARGRMLDEALDVAKRLWTEEVVEHHGEHWSFGPVMFEPKPVQRPHPPILVGGESPAALRRAARHDGWMSMPHTFETAAIQIERLRRLRREAIDGRMVDDAEPGNDRSFTVTVCTLDPALTTDDLARWADLGVDRLVVKPWNRTRDALDGLRSFRDLGESWFEGALVSAHGTRPHGTGRTRAHRLLLRPLVTMVLPDLEVGPPAGQARRGGSVVAVLPAGAAQRARAHAQPGGGQRAGTQRPARPAHGARRSCVGRQRRRRPVLRGVGRPHMGRRTASR